jgi:hypothetical protein
MNSFKLILIIASIFLANCQLRDLTASAAVVVEPTDTEWTTFLNLCATKTLTTGIAATTLSTCKAATIVGAPKCCLVTAGISILTVTSCNAVRTAAEYDQKTTMSTYECGSSVMTGLVGMMVTIMAFFC